VSGPRPLEGKVAIVTGAARGLGRVEALELARLGARVVVNDLGAGADGSGRDETAARAVVAEIAALGGEAVPHAGDVAVWDDARGLVATAVERFGDLHILVNNAGFCRDRMLFNMSEEDFDAVIRVHLKGHFCTMRFAAEHWRSRAKAAGAPVYGRLVSTSSEAFVFGSPGQPNYAAAKAGIVAMTMAAAQSLARTASPPTPSCRGRARG
jgi:NAD(P)-dependent dehydrogenase (short-subunit alcohol dehydrogenase family)